jgi:hypothetical protein
MMAPRRETCSPRPSDACPYAIGHFWPQGLVAALVAWVWMGDGHESLLRHQTVNCSRRQRFSSCSSSDGGPGHTRVKDLLSQQQRGHREPR